MPNTLRQWIAHLETAASAPGAPYRVFDGTVESLSDGLAYLVIPPGQRASRCNGAIFGCTREGLLRERQARRAGDPPPDFRRYAVRWVVCWPRLLEKACFSATGDGIWSLRPLAQELLHLVVDLVAQYDYALSTQIQAFAARRRAGTADPLFFGQVSALDEARFDAHLQALCHNALFVRRLSRSLRASLGGALSTERTREIGRIPQLASVQRFVHVLEPLRGVRGARVNLRLYRPDYFQEMTSPWLRELRYLLSLRDGEGVAWLTKPERLLVDYSQILSDTRAQQRDSVLQLFLDAPVTDTWRAGVLARTAAEEAFGKEALALRDRPLETYVRSAGWSWHPSTHTPFALYSVAALLQRLERGQRGVAHLSRVRRRALPQTRTARTAHMVYLTFGEAPVTVIRRKQHRQGTVQNYYSLPFGILRAHDTRRAFPTDRRSIGDTSFWSLRGINHLANIRTAAGEPTYPAATTFREWAITEDSTLNAQRFNQLRFEQGHGARLAEMAAGTRQQLPRFTTHEKQIIEDFLRIRGKGGKRLDTAEWAALTDLLPGRAAEGIRRQIRISGKAYARIHGYRAYASSFWCLSRVTTRRDRWRKAGCPA